MKQVAGTHEWTKESDYFFWHRIYSRESSRSDKVSTLCMYFFALGFLSLAANVGFEILGWDLGVMITTILFIASLAIMACLMIVGAKIDSNRRYALEKSFEALENQFIEKLDELKTVDQTKKQK